ncbi:MAG: hypothetical protein AB1629_08205 [Candidatus Omnitrophota bacterium]
MKKVFILSSFERSIKRFTSQDKEKLEKSLEAFNSFLSKGEAPLGFRFKKINHDKYEFRIDIHLRVIVKVEDDNFYLVLAGNHDDVKRYLRNYR